MLASTYLYSFYAWFVSVAASRLGAGSELKFGLSSSTRASRFAAKFNYAIWFGAGSELVRSWFEAGSMQIA